MCGKMPKATGRRRAAAPPLFTWSLSLAPSGDADFMCLWHRMFGCEWCFAKRPCTPKHLNGNETEKSVHTEHNYFQFQQGTRTRLWATAKSQPLTSSGASLSAGPIHWHENWPRSVASCPPGLQPNPNRRPASFQQTNGRPRARAHIFIFGLFILIGLVINGGFFRSRSVT